MNYNHLHYFHVVANSGSLSAAASELGVTVPTVSEQIKQLESSLGKKLFHRTGNGLRLTEIGRLAQQHTAVMFRESQRMVERLDLFDQVDRQLLEVGVATTVSRSFAAEYFLALFELDGAFVRIHTGDEMQMLQNLMMREIDLLVTDQPISDPEQRGIVSETVQKPRLIAFAAPRLATICEEFPADLGKLPLMHYTRSSRYRWEIDSFFRKHGVSPNIVGEVADIGIMRAVAAQGAAMCILPTNTHHPANGHLFSLGELDGIESDVVVAYKSEDPSDHVRAAVDALKAGFALT